MRLAHFVFAATILTFPRSATAGIWGWFDKPSEPEVKEDAPPIATEKAPAVEASLSVDTTSEDEPVVNSLPVEEVPVETISHIDPLLSSAPNFVAWFRSHGGYVDDRITIGYEPGSTLRGLIATAPIPAETILIHTPASLILSSGNLDDKCKLIDIIKNEMELEAQSKWHTYFGFDDNSGSHLPMNWHQEEHAILLDEFQGLPPTGDTHNHINWYQRECVQNEQLTDLDWRALGMYLTRAADIGMVPMYDLMNFHNGNINTRMQRDADDTGLVVVSSTDISAGTPIYNSCSRGGWKSTDHVFNDYGYVEDYPQLWRWTDDEWHNLPHEEWDNAYANNADFEPNVPAYEVLVVSPTLAAISPSKQLVGMIGHGHRSLEEWQREIDAHHANLRAPRARAIRAVAKVLEMLPTTIEQDEVLLANMMEEKRAAGSADFDVGKENLMKVIDYRLSFKKALKLTIDVIDREWERFYVENVEL